MCPSVQGNRMRSLLRASNGSNLRSCSAWEYSARISQPSEKVDEIRGVQSICRRAFDRWITRIVGYSPPDEALTADLIPRDRHPKILRLLNEAFSRTQTKWKIWAWRIFYHERIVVKLY